MLGSLFYVLTAIVFVSCRYKKHKALDDQEAKFENAKRRLKESYQQHDKG